MTTTATPTTQKFRAVVAMINFFDNELTQSIVTVTTKDWRLAALEAELSRIADRYPNEPETLEEYSESAVSYFMEFAEGELPSESDKSEFFDGDSCISVIWLD